MGRYRFRLLVMALGLVAALFLLPPQVTLASDAVQRSAPNCHEMPHYQIPSRSSGSGCRIPVEVLNVDDRGYTQVYRSGWTYMSTSESDSDFIENLIRVTGYAYYRSGGNQSLMAMCTDPQYNATHAACNTFPGNTANYQKGYHFFRKSGYADQSFWTEYSW
jgi:hypothetical protein